VIDPRFMTVHQWTDAVSLTLSTRAQTTTLIGDDWQQWAYNLISAPAIANFAPPNPGVFTDWRLWAERFVECVPL
jgi:hypothetical protein